MTSASFFDQRTLLSDKRVATPISHTPAHNVTATVAPFRAWRGSQLIIARGPTGATIEGPHYGQLINGFQPSLI